MSQNLGKEELDREIVYLNSVMDVLKENISKFDADIQDDMNEITEMKHYIWDNLGVLDDVEIATGIYDVNTNVDKTNERIHQLHVLKKSLVSPYFGRIDFKTDDDLSSYYIGINSINKDAKLYVLDWRTPAASLFYNFGTGPAHFIAPIGKISGEVTLKRQYKIKDEKIERCFNSDLNIDDEYLQEILAKSSTDKMTNIVSTIQAEQNQIIRNMADRYLLVQGVAGSGKTSVALHRIAYLLYAEKNLRYNNVLIFSPNNTFSNYISDVLPDLGENNVLQTTFTRFTNSFIKGYANIENQTEFIEKYYSNNKAQNNELIKYKLSDEFKEYLDKYLEDYINSLRFQKGFIIKGKEIRASYLNALFHHSYKGKSIDTRIDLVAGKICDLLGTRNKSIKNKLKLALIQNLNKSIDYKKVYQQVLQEETLKQLGAKPEDFKFSGKLRFEDLLPLMHIKFTMNGYATDSNIKHVIIDEAQDYTPLQISILKNIFPRASFTVLGDINQTINPYYKYDSFRQLEEIFPDKSRFIELNKTYRSSQEIIEYTNRILDIDNVCSIRHNNKRPVILKDVTCDFEETLIDDIKSLKTSNNRIGIITKSLKEAIELYESIKDKVENVSVCDGNESALSEIVILPSYMSKGLEFDSIISYSKSDMDYLEKDKYLYYVVCTRAQNSLIIYNPPKLEKKKVR